MSYISDLSDLTYIELRKIAMGLHLPGNLKKAHMIPLIEAVRSNDEKRKNMILQSIVHERQTKAARRGKVSPKNMAALKTVCSNRKGEDEDIWKQFILTRSCLGVRHSEHNSNSGIMLPRNHTLTPAIPLKSSLNSPPTSIWATYGREPLTPKMIHPYSLHQASENHTIAESKCQPVASSPTTPLLRDMAPYQEKRHSPLVWRKRTRVFQVSPSGTYISGLTYSGCDTSDTTCRVTWSTTSSRISPQLVPGMSGYQMNYMKYILNDPQVSMENAQAPQMVTEAYSQITPSPIFMTETDGNQHRQKKQQSVHNESSLEDASCDEDVDSDSADEHGEGVVLPSFSEVFSDTDMRGAKAIEVLPNVHTRNQQGEVSWMNMQHSLDHIRSNCSQTITEYAPTTDVIETQPNLMDCAVASGVNHMNSGTPICQFATKCLSLSRSDSEQRLKELSGDWQQHTVHNRPENEAVSSAEDADSDSTEEDGEEHSAGPVFPCDRQAVQRNVARDGTARGEGFTTDHTPPVEVSGLTIQDSLDLYMSNCARQLMTTEAVQSAIGIQPTLQSYAVASGVDHMNTELSSCYQWSNVARSSQLWTPATTLKWCFKHYQYDYCALNQWPYPTWI